MLVEKMDLNLERTNQERENHVKTLERNLANLTSEDLQS